MKRLMQALAALATVISAGMVQAASQTTYYHNDLAGSPVAATNESRQVIWRESYRPYGERTVNSAAATGNKVWFTSRRQDAETGLVYMGARYYDPVIGRFISTDPAGFDEQSVHSFNRYAYGNNNPYVYHDPDGRIPVPLIVGAGLLVRAAAQRLATLALTRGAQASIAAAEIGAGEAMGAGSIAAGAVAAERAVAKGADAIIGGEKLLYRLGSSPESASRLGRKSAEAEHQIGLHGVSSSTTKPPEGTPCSVASCAGLEARGFRVEPTPTRNDPGHHTVLLPKPVTKDVANDFNQAFGRN